MMHNKGPERTRLYSHHIVKLGLVVIVCSGTMNNYIVRSSRDVIVITKFVIAKFAIRRASKAQSKVMY